jgi:hypothetical protein
MHKLIGLAAVVAAAAVAGSALAAPPTKGGVYEGALYATSAVALKKKVRLVVNKTGTSARVLWWCGEGRPPSTRIVRIAADGSFKGNSNVGGALTVWSIKGQFVTRTKARASLQLKVTCDGKGGTLNLLLKQ